MDSCITAYAITDQCEEIEIADCPALHFLLQVIDDFSKLLESSNKPKITVSLFEKVESNFVVTITPKSISDLLDTNTNKTFLFTLSLSVNETVIFKAFTQLLLLVRICNSLIGVLGRRRGLTFKQNLAIISSNSASLDIAFSKHI